MSQHASGFLVACLIRKAVAPVVAVPIITKRGITSGAFVIAERTIFLANWNVFVANLGATLTDKNLSQGLFKTAVTLRFC